MMRLARELELRLERLVDGASAALFRGRLHPVDMADRLVRQVDFLQFDVPAGPQIPNDLRVRISPADLDPELKIHDLERELANVVEATAAARGWRIGGPLRVVVSTDEAVPRGLLECEGTTAPGPLPAWGQLLARDGSGAMDLTDNRVLIGRELDCDVILPNPAVSRHHALIVREVGSPYIEDLASSNGTYVNGARVATDTPLIPGDAVVIADATFTFRVV